MDRKTYMKDIYSRYWSYAREKEYGFLEYDKNLCNYIIKNVSKGGNVLDVGIGTGFPFGDFLQKGGYDVHGIDIAPILIEKCKKLNNKINCKVGDAENLTYPNNFFDCTYSFHSTFYFPNLCKVISEMIRVTNPNGLIIFDIQNKNNNEMHKNIIE
jgi:Methylase involved in ubiquinone/menaquinone biosynthesis